MQSHQQEALGVLGSLASNFGLCETLVLLAVDAWLMGVSNSPVLTGQLPMLA